MTRGVECSRSPNGKHDIIKGDVLVYCRHCWVVPRYLMDDTDDVRIVPKTKVTPKSKRATVGPMKGTTKANRLAALVERDGLQCFYCEHDLDTRWTTGRWYPTIDHLLPRSLGGAHDLDNLVLACTDCNGRKGHGVRELVEVITRLRSDLKALQAARDGDQAFIDHMKWELFDAGIGEMPGLTVIGKAPRKRHWHRPRSGLRDMELYTELGERVCANLRAENVGAPHARTASVVKRGRLLVRRELIASSSGEVHQ